jgi:hypothetical protein
MALTMVAVAETSANEIELQNIEPDELDIENPAKQRSDTALSDTTTLLEDRSSTSVVPSASQLTVAKPVELIRIHSSPPFTEDDSGVIPVPEKFTAEATHRMAWIMETGMSILLPQLRPEERQILEGSSDLNDMICRLFQSWERFRNTDNGGTKSRRVAVAVHEMMKMKFSNHEVFDKFWSRKLASERDEAAWARFKKTVKTVLGQIDLIDRVLDSANMGHVTQQGIYLIVDVFACARDHRCPRPIPERILPNEMTNIIGGAKDFRCV